MRVWGIRCGSIAPLPPPPWVQGGVWSERRNETIPLACLFLFTFLWCFLVVICPLPPFRTAFKNRMKKWEQCFGRMLCQGAHTLPVQHPIFPSPLSLALGVSLSSLSLSLSLVSGLFSFTYSFFGFIFIFIFIFSSPTVHISLSFHHG